MQVLCDLQGDFLLFNCQTPELEALKDTNIDTVQGYYYSKPMPAKDFEKLFL